MRNIVITILLALAASVSLFAQTSGKCGPNLTWSLSNGVLTISGTGPMNDFASETIPWHENKSGISSVVIDSSVTSIGKSAFSHCSGLTSISGGNGLTSIGVQAFEMCNALTVVNIPNQVTSIGSYAFMACRNLTTLSIPKSVTSIGARAFGNCDSLSQVFVYNPVPITIIGQDDWDFLMIFYTNGSSGIRVPNNLTIYVPCASLDAYKSAEYWSDYASRMEPLPFPDVICNVKDTNRGVVNTFIPPTACDSAVFTATPNEGYYFSKWSDNTTSNPYVLYASQDTTITAIFEKSIYTVQTQANNPLYGTTVGDASAYYLDTVTITAIPNNGYRFSQWSDGVTDNPRTVIVTADSTFEAIFVIDDTAIRTVDSSSTLPQKTLQDGHLYILLPNGTRYTATGQLVK